MSSEWVPVGERLSPLLTDVLGWHPADRVRAWFRHSGQPKDAPYWESWEPQDRECDDCEVEEPTHWMNLPEPPEVISPKLTPESVALLREQWDALHKGPPRSPPEVTP